MKLGIVRQTDRRFEFIEFKDRNRKPCTLQQSSAMDNTERGIQNPGSSFVWLGTEEDRMHLSRDQVQMLIGHLQAWMETGSLDGMGELA